MSPLIATLSGIRGIYGDGLTPEVIRNYTLAFGSLYGPKIVIGRDTRTSGPEIESTVSKTLLSIGCTPIHLGLVTTPATQLAVENLNADGGIIISASHNPAEWNALKLVASDGSFLPEAGFKKLQDKLDLGEYDFVDDSSVGEKQIYAKANEDHIGLILSLSYLEVEKIKKRAFKVVVDCVNGVASEVLPDLLGLLGCEVTKIHCEPNGLFPHTPEPLEHNLSDLIEKTKENEADIGFAVDPDGDRLAIVSDGGKYLSEEYTLVIATDVVLSGLPEGQKVVTNLSTTRAVDDIAEKHGAEVIRTRVGEINVVQEMKKVKAVIGGEGNGGVILSEAHYGRDALVAAASALQFLTNHEEPLSEIYSKMPQYVMLKRKAELGGVPTDSILKLIAGHFSEYDVDTRDGVKVNKPEGWLHARVSNTEPIMRIYVEAKTKESAESIWNELVNIPGLLLRVV
ncbi:MAG: phosphoglucosamine mutase [Candidatus Marinimicrobia bacterium]|nr:phosphoglucosamine mutase [Candidatus Neomarinimicrobiota bacterium]